MQSPFPGMDPYLEPHWLDVHTSLVSASRNALNDRLPEDLIARAEERVAIESGDDEPLRLISPDVRVFQAMGVAPYSGEGSGSDVAVAPPYRLVTIIEPVTERFIEIVDSTGERLVTVIEFVSPTNNRGKGLEAFRDKREELLAGDVNIVEVDLTRSGDWRALLAPHHCRKKLLSHYRAVVRVPNDPGAAYLYPISLRHPLPKISIPLRRHDKPVDLELQPLIEQAYRNGRYARTIDYRKPLDPPLDDADAAWADELLRTAGRR